MTPIQNPFPEPRPGDVTRATIAAMSPAERRSSEDAIDWDRLAYEDCGADLNGRVAAGEIVVYQLTPDRYAFVLTGWAAGEQAEELAYQQEMGGYTLRETLDKIMESLWPDERDGDSND